MHCDTTAKNKRSPTSGLSSNADRLQSVYCSTDPPVNPYIVNEMKQTLPYLALIGFVGTSALETRHYLATFDDLAGAETNIDAAPFMRYESYDGLIWGNFRIFCLQRRHLQTID